MSALEEKASSALELSLKWEEIDEQFGFLKQRAIEAELKEASVRKQTLELETSLKQLEARENELEKKEENFLLNQQIEAREIEVKSKVLESKEKELEEREKDIELKQREMEERAIQSETRKRSRLESESLLLAEKGTDADQTLIRPGKKHKPISTQHDHYDENKEKVLALVVPDSTSSPVWISEAHGGEIVEAVSIDDSDEDAEPFTCSDPEFKDFSNTMSSFVVGQVWALYDPIDEIPRYYAQIKRIFEHQLRLRVKWLEAVETTENEEPYPACGRFKKGKSETQSLLMFSHEMYYTIHGENVIINPRKGEIWALFKDWTKTWNIHREQHKTPYRYDFVEVLFKFDSDQGIGVAYLGKVEGFTSVYKLAEVNGCVKFMIASDEMLRFSHRLPSFKLTGDEKEGVPAGSFELDFAVVPLHHLNVDAVLSIDEEKKQSEGSSNGNRGKNLKVIDRPATRKKNYETRSATSGSSNQVVQKQPQLSNANRKRKFNNRISDITKGSESAEISLLDDVGSEDVPKFTYIPHNIVYQSAYVHVSLARISDEDCCANCKGNCPSAALPCTCARETSGEYAYTKEELLKDEFLDTCLKMKKEPDTFLKVYSKDCPLERDHDKGTHGKCDGHLIRKFIKECWRKCGCDMWCGNRVVQRGIRCRLQVYFTQEGKGWGLRILDDLPKGTFVCEYIGEILTNTELYERNIRSSSERHTYPVTLDADWGSEKELKDEKALCLDATICGNVARFINHRCEDANMIDIPVEIEIPDRHYYHIAFFTIRDVKAMDELTWDYMIDFNDKSHPVKAFRCCCGSESCRDKKKQKDLKASL